MNFGFQKWLLLVQCVDFWVISLHLCACSTWLVTPAWYYQSKWRSQILLMESTRSRRRNSQRHSRRRGCKYQIWIAYALRTSWMMNVNIDCDEPNKYQFTKQIKTYFSHSYDLVSKSSLRMKNKPPEICEKISWCRLRWWICIGQTEIYFSYTPGMYSIQISITINSNSLI